MTVTCTDYEIELNSWNPSSPLDLIDHCLRVLYKSLCNFPPTTKKHDFTGNYKCIQYNQTQGKHHIESSSSMPKMLHIDSIFIK